MDRAWMVVHGRAGTGAKDREVPLPQQTLPLLRHSGTTPRNPVWLLPAPGRSGLGMATASTPMPRHSVHEALRAALRARGIPTRASVPTLRHAWATPLLEAGVTLRLMQHSLRHPSPAPTALSPHLTVTVEALATAAITRLLDALSGRWEDCHARTGGERPTRWPGLSHHMRRPYAPTSPGSHAGHRTVPDCGPGRARLVVPRVRRPGVPLSCLHKPAWSHVSA